MVPSPVDGGGAGAAVTVGTAPTPARAAPGVAGLEVWAVAGWAGRTAWWDRGCATTVVMADAWADAPPPAPPLPRLAKCGLRLSVPASWKFARIERVLM